MICTPKDNETTEVFLARRGNGKNMLLINVIINGELTSAWENTTDNGAWRDKNGNKGGGKLIDHSNINICCNTMSLSRGDLEELAKELAELSRLLPATPIGDIRRSSPEALDVLDKLMHGGVEIIRKSMKLDLTTPLFEKRRELGKRIDLLIDGELSEDAREVLSSFKESQRFYAKKLPELSRFTGDKRSSGDPSDKGGKIRASIKALNGINIPPRIHLDFVEYELKPLRISQVVGWTAQLDGCDNADPRKDSMDILLSCNKVPVHTEVKAQGDSYCSSAFVQILYYGCVLANQPQQRRLHGQFQLDDAPAWLAVIAEERNEAEERGFDSDRIMTVNFLQHRKTQEALRPFFHGVFIIVVRRNPDSTYSVVEEQTNMIEFGE